MKKLNPIEVITSRKSIDPYKKIGNQHQIEERLAKNRIEEGQYVAK